MAVQLPKTIRQWFTPEQACQYLSQAFECEITKKDLEHFHFEGQINFQVRVTRDIWFAYQYECPQIYECSNIVPSLDMELLGREPQEDERVEILFHISPQIYKGACYDPNEEVETFIIYTTDLLALWRIINADRIIKNVKNTAPITLKTIRKIEKIASKANFIEIQRYIDDVCVADLGYTKAELNMFIESQIITTTDNSQQIARPTPIASQHRENLLRRIKAEGLDALQLTAGKGGKSGSKAQIKALLVPNTMTNSQFEKTWESAMRDQVIQYNP